MTNNNKISRRNFLRGLGGLVVVVAGAGVWRAADQGVFSAGTGPAFTAWDAWRADMNEGPLSLVHAAILAASPHNTQPWIFDVQDEQIDLYADTSRHLGAMDPYLREMYIGLGCAVENMLVAAGSHGYTVDLTLAEGALTTGQAARGITKVATLRLTEADVQPSALAAAIPNRRTNRYDYTGEPLPETTYAQMIALNSDDDLAVLFYPAGTAAFAQFQAGTVAGAEYIVADPEMARASFDWFPSSWDNMQETKSGPYIDTAGVAPVMRAVVKMVPGMPSIAAVDSAMVADAQRHFDTASAAGMVAVRSLYDINQTLRAGQLWQRLHLWGTLQNLAMQPHSEMPEVVDRQSQLGLPNQMAQHLSTIMGDEGWRPTLTFRLGLPTVAPLPSPRRPAQEVVRSVGQGA